MADKFSHEMLMKVVAQICQVVGFDKIMTSVLYTLSDILGAFLKNLGRVARRYSEHSGRTLINERDLSLAFYDFNIIPSELVDFLELVSPLPEPVSVPVYPVATGSQLSFQHNFDILQQDTGENVSDLQSQLKENLKIKISLKKIREASNMEVKCKKSKKKKKNKENRKRNQV